MHKTILMTEKLIYLFNIRKMFLAKTISIDKNNTP